MSTHTVSLIIRRWIEMQGVTGLDDAALAEIGPLLRLAPAVCSALIAVATFLGLPIAFWALMPLGLICAIFGIHPVNLLYNLGPRHLFGTRYIPRSGAPMRFSCLIAALWLGSTGIAFVVGVPLLGYALGAALVLATGVAATTSFCPGCFIYERLKSGPVAQDQTPG
jgi:hypothetical protein